MDGHRIRIAGLLVVLLAVALSACRLQPFPRVLKIGLVAPFEGRYRPVGYDVIYAARLAVREINAAGGVGGYRLALVAYDDRADPQMARENAQALAVDPDVMAVIGHYRQETTAAAAPIYADAGLPMLAIGGWILPVRAGVWQLSAPPDRMTAAMIGAVDMECIRSLNIVGTGPLVSNLRERGRAQGLSLNGSELAGEGPPSSEGVLSLLAPYEAAEALLRWRAAGWDGMLVGDVELGAAAFGKIADEAAASARFVTPYPLPSDLAGSEAWIEAYRGVGPHVPDPSYYAMPTYEAVYLVGEAVAAALDGGGEPERVQIGSAMPRVFRSGLLGDLSWDADGYVDGMPLYLYAWDPAISRPQLLKRLP